ncbi:MAG: ankyrin repeat domain-containing protein, partial [Planctomycetota bacterium]
HVLNSPDDLEFAPQLQRLAKRRVLQTGHESTSGYTYVQVHNRNGCSLTFQSNQVRHGKGTSETESHASTKLVSRKYPKRWLDQFNETADIHQALIRDLDAYVPMLQWIAEGEHLRVDACHADAADAENVASATLVLFGEKRPRSGLAANTAMLKAILAEDPAGTRAALASGASLETLPNFRCPPLCRALSHWKKNPSQAKQVVQVLLQAGADPNNGGSNGPPPIFVAIGTHNAQQKLGASFVDLLADAGADINRYHQERESLGWTPLHAAISDTNDAAVRVLIEHSADVFAVDHEGKTPREFLIERRSFILDFLGPDRSKKRIRQLDLCENMVIAAEGKRNR